MKKKKKRECSSSSSSSESSLESSSSSSSSSSSELRDRELKRKRRRRSKRRRRRSELEEVIEKFALAREKAQKRKLISKMNERRDRKSRNVFHLISHGRTSARNLLELVRCLLNDFVNDDVELSQMMLFERDRGKQRMPIEYLSRNRFVIEQEPYVFEIVRKKMISFLNEFGDDREIIESVITKSAARFENARKLLSEEFEQRKEQAMNSNTRDRERKQGRREQQQQHLWDEKIRCAMYDDDGDDELYERLWEFEERHQTRSDDVRAKSTIKEKEKEKGNESKQQKEEEEEEIEFKSPTERELRKRGISITTTSSSSSSLSYFDRWQNALRKAEKNLLKCKDLPFLHDIKKGEDVIKWILIDCSIENGRCSCQTNASEQQSEIPLCQKTRACSLKILKGEMLRWHPDRFVPRFKGRFKTKEEEDEAVIKINHSSQIITEIFRDFKNSERDAIH